MPDRIHLEGMVFYGYHGNNPAERELGQRFVVDLTVTADLRRAGTSDSIEDTVNYSRLYNTVRGVVEGESRKLLEAVAEEVARQILEQSTLVQCVGVRIAKPGATIRGSILKEAAVEIERVRSNNG